MIVLGLDTATKACSAAIWTDGAVLAHECMRMERGHTEVLIPMVGRVLGAAALAFCDLHLVAVTVGPGTFTGLRVGLAAARGIALAADIPCIGVTTLEAIAAAVPRRERDGRIILVVLETKRGDFYAQAFSADGTGLAAPRSVDAAVLPDLVEGRDAVVAGDAGAAAIAELRAAGMMAEPAGMAEFADAGVVAGIAARRFRTKGRPLRRPLPLYVRRPEAQIAVSGGRRRP
jgi:tRNA threonylcarbamoyladenosine biosynthesis protein TsaB